MARPNPDGGYSPPRGANLDRPQSMTRAWVKILRYMGRYRWLLAVALFMAVLESLFVVFAPNKLTDMTNLIEIGLKTGYMDIPAIGQIGLAILGLYVMSTLVMFIRYRATSTISQKFGGSLRRDMADKMNRLPLSYVDSFSKGDLMSRFANDTDTIGAALNNGLGTFIHGIASFFLTATMMFLTNVTLTLVVIAASAVGAVASVVVIKSTQKYYRNQQRDIGRMYGLVSELYSSKPVVMAYCGERMAKEEFDGINDSLRDSCLKSEITVGLLPAAVGFVNNLGYVLVCIVGALMVLDGQITIGVIVAFIVYVKMFGGPLDMITSSINRLQAAAAAGERVFEFLDHPEMEEDPAASDISKSEVRGHVEFRDVRFGYDRDREIIHGFTAEVQPGQKVAIVGPTGAGKTTVVNLLMRFYEMDSGDILIDGVSIRDMTRKQVHEMFCMVLQDTWLFDGTVRENVRYCNDASDEEIEEVCKAVGLGRFVEGLPQGYDTPLDQNLDMSTGQKQQITIARAMVDRSPMLILDEATSSVDTRTEKTIQKTMANLTEGRTSFVIAHRLSTIRDADLIIVMDKGRIVEQGTHEGLLRENGFYRRLYDSQFDA